MKLTICLLRWAGELMKNGCLLMLANTNKATNHAYISLNVGSMSELKVGARLMVHNTDM